MDPRVKHVELNRGEHLVFGRKFSTSEAAEQYASETIRRREALANRTLTGEELENGLPRKDNRSALEKSRDRLWQITPVSQPAAEEPNPFRAAMARGDHLPKKKEDRAALYRRAAKEWDQKVQDQQAAEEFANCPRRAKAVAIAEAALETSLFDPAASFSEVNQARMTLEQCRRGCLDVAKQMLDEGRIVREQRHDAKTAELDRAIFELRQQRMAHVGEAFEPAAPAAPSQPFFSQERLDELAREDMDRMTREGIAEQQRREAMGPR
jgi:hypothetical protein